MLPWVIHHLETYSAVVVARVAVTLDSAKASEYCTCVGMGRCTKGELVSQEDIGRYKYCAQSGEQGIVLLVRRKSKRGREAEHFVYLLLPFPESSIHVPTGSS